MLVISGRTHLMGSLDIPGIGYYYLPRTMFSFVAAILAIITSAGGKPLHVSHIYMAVTACWNEAKHDMAA